MKKSNIFSLYFIFALIAIFISISCGKGGGTSSDEFEANLNVYELTTESVTTALGGLADEGSGSDFTFSRAACTRATSETCSSGTKTATYSACTASGTLFTRTGTVVLSYSQTSDCSMNLPGDYIVRTYDYTISGARGGSLQITSSAATDYRGNSISGGGKITKTLSGYTVQVLGKHKVLTYNGSEVLNHSIRSLTSSTITGSLARSGRSLTGGELEVADNRNEFVATITPSNLQWSASCCYPVSGSYSITLSGSTSGTATVSFSSTCGDATYSLNGGSRSINLRYCE